MDGVPLDEEEKEEEEEEEEEDIYLTQIHEYTTRAGLPEKP